MKQRRLSLVRAPMPSGFHIGRFHSARRPGPRRLSRRREFPPEIGCLGEHQFYSHFTRSSFITVVGLSPTFAIAASISALDLPKRFDHWRAKTSFEKSTRFRFGFAGEDVEIISRVPLMPTTNIEWQFCSPNGVSAESAAYVKFDVPSDTMPLSVSRPVF